MLKGLEKTLNKVIEEGKKTAEVGNFKVSKNEVGAISVYHYYNRVAVVDLENKIIVKTKFWNYSMSTTRLCNDLKRYFEGYELV